MWQLLKSSSSLSLYASGRLSTLVYAHMPEFMSEGCVLMLQHGMPAPAPIATSAAARAQQLASQWGGEGDKTSHFEAELEINDFPQHARWKVRLALLLPVTRHWWHLGPLSACLCLASIFGSGAARAWCPAHHIPCLSGSVMCSCWCR